MRYGKLLAVLLSTAAAERPDSLDQRIAQYIMDHLGDPEAITMKRIGQSCHVGIASVSRFCRKIGLRDFSELRELVGEVPFQASADAADPFAGIPSWQGRTAWWIPCRRRRSAPPAPTSTAITGWRCSAS